MKSEKKQSKKDIATSEDGPGDDSKKKARPSQKPKQPSSTSNEEHPAVARVQRSATPFHNIPFACPGILPFVKDRKFVSMTPVQAATIPQIIHHRKDVVVQAVTGSGKTLAFLLPLVELIFARQDKLKGHQIGGLVLSPTRELALQTYRVALDLCKACEMPEPLLLVGGGSASSGSHKNTTNIRPVTQDLQRFQELKSDILIGTCGRVEDVLTRYSVIDTSELECLILDEADVLLNMGFAQSLQAIMGRLPKHRRTGLFSATTQNTMLSEWMKRAGVRNPVYIDVSVSSSREDSTDRQKGGSGTITPSTLTNYYIVTTLEEKLSRLVAFLQDHSKEKIIVFFLTCACVQFYGQALQEYGIDVELLHGKLVQKRREKAMERFREGTNGAILFCTDVAARGLDVSDVNWVVQFDAPQDPAFFVHRVGRSARAGRSGSSLLFLTRKEEPYIELLLNRKVPLQKLPASERCCPPETELEDQRKSEIKSPGIKQILCARDSHESIENVLPIVRGLVMKDRDLLEKGTKAYTSYIRAYKEHHCAFIFR